jgi:CRP-like cAMP-binding protein
VRRIGSVIAGAILFKQLEADERRTVVDAMEEKVFEAGAVVIEQGAVGDFFYVVESGTVDILVGGAKVSEAGPGGYFGELALMYNAPRAASVVATSGLRTWALDQVTFKKTLMGATMDKRARHEAFVASVPALQSLTAYERLTIADALAPVECAEGRVVIREGEEGDTFYIVEEGEVRVTKEGVPGEVSRRLGRGDYFGERALIMDERRAATVTAVTPTLCQAIDRATFKRLLGPLEDVLRANMAVYEQYKDTFDAAHAAEERDRDAAHPEPDHTYPDTDEDE